MKRLLILTGVLFMTWACQKTSPPPENLTDLSQIPQPTAVDEPYKGVFKMLDGTWEGAFYVYEDSMGQKPGNARPRITNVEFADLRLREVRYIDVRQEYISETPFFQRVVITDRYVNEGGDTQLVVSQGVNKVQNGELWCIVNKPDETIVHRGTLADANTIIWQREERDPLKIEYFHESVEGDYYKIIGWGYYGDDDPNLSPKTWFVGDYSRVTAE